MRNGLPACGNSGNAPRPQGTAFLKETRLYPAASKRLPPEAQAALAAGFEKMQPHSFALTATELSSRSSSFDRLGDLSIPALIVAGTRDKMFMEHLPGMLAQMPPDLVETVKLEGAGHAANLEQPGEFEAALVRFAERVGAHPTEEPR